MRINELARVNRLEHAVNAQEGWSWFIIIRELYESATEAQRREAKASPLLKAASSIVLKKN